jgi:hypothetical protein
MHCLYCAVISVISSSLWCITLRVYAPGHEVCIHTYTHAHTHTHTHAHTPCIQFLFSDLDTYIFIISFPHGHFSYLHHKFHVLMNCTHIWHMYHIHQIENTTFIFWVVQNVLKSLFQYLGTLLWILYRPFLRWHNTVFVSVLCFHSV